MGEKLLDDLFSGNFLNDITTNIEDTNKRSVAHSIRDHIKRGASINTIASYQTDALKTTLSFFRVAGRSRLTYKEDMAKKLIEVFGGDEDKHGKASRGEEEKVARRQENDNMILRNIKLEEDNVKMNRTHNEEVAMTTMEDYHQSIDDSFKDVKKVDSKEKKWSRSRIK